MEIKINKKDILWSYSTQFFAIASGIIVLPLILRSLSSDEIGLNYLMLTIGSMVAMLDFGFSPQFGRNITYIFSGAQELQKEGIQIVSKDQEVNYKLLATIIYAAKFIYLRLSLVVLFFMLSLGTIYIYWVTKGFSTVNNSLFIWVIYSISTFFNIYYSYYTSLLIGKSLIKESNKAILLSKIIYIILVWFFLYLNVGLLGVVLANLIAPFVMRYLSYRYFFTTKLKDELSKYHITKEEKISSFITIWYNAKKLGLVSISAYAINKSSIFLASLYLSLNEIASYGLMIQLIGLISVISSTLFSIHQPKFSSLRVENNTDKLIKDFAFTMNIYYVLFLLGASFLILIGPWALSLINSNTILPSMVIVLIYAFVMFLEGNHSNFAAIIMTKNNIPFVKPSLIAGGVIAIGCFISLKYTSFGILGLVLVQGVCQLFYANWKWPYVVCKEFHISFTNFIKLGFNITIEKFKERFIYEYK